jgi:hypothetical protein
MHTISSQNSASSQNPAETSAPQKGYTIDWEHLSPISANGDTYFDELLPKSVKETFSSIVYAMEAGEDTFVCENSYALTDMFMLIKELYPVGEFIASYRYDEEAGCGKLDYLDAATRVAVLKAFKNRVQKIVNEAGVLEKDTPVVRALLIYHYLSKTLDYDYAALEDVSGKEALADVSPYRAIMDGKGICQSFAGAYAYLCHVVGVDAVSISGGTENYSLVHEWNLLTFDGVRYFCDVTFEEGTGVGNGLQYFGFTQEQRADIDGFIVGHNNILNILIGEPTETGNAFEKLRTCSNVKSIERKNDGIRILFEDSEGNEASFKL